MNKHFWCFFISRNIETEVVSCIQCQCLGNIQQDKFDKLVNEKKEKSTGAVFMMVIETSQLYFIHIFIYFSQAFDLFCKDRFQGNCYNKSRKKICSRLATKIIQKSKMISI